MKRFARLMIFAAAVAWCLCARADAGVRIASMTGKVEMRADASGAWKPAVAGRGLGQGAWVRTGAGATCMLKWSDGHAAKVQALTVVSVSKLGAGADGVNELGMNSGKVTVHVRKKSDKAIRFMVKTPAVIAGVRGTDFFVEIKDGGDTSVGVLEGTVVAEAGGREFDVPENFYIEVDAAGAAAEPEPMTEPMRQENIDDVKEVREEAAAAETSTQPDESKQPAAEEKQPADASAQAETLPAETVAESAVEAAVESAENVVENQTENIETAPDAQVIEGLIHVDVYLNQ